MAEKPLFEMPQLHTTPVDFGLGDRARNRAEYERLADSDYTVIEENDKVLFAHAYDREENRFEIFLLSFVERALVYYVEFVPHKVPRLGMCATQVILWRRAGAGVAGITTRVFNEFLLKRFDAVVSDKNQTADGRRFWIDRMAEASTAGKCVGLLDDNRLVSVFDGGDITQWLTDNNGWGEGTDFRSLQYFVAKRPVDAA